MHDTCQTKLDFGQGLKGSCMVAEGKKFHCKVCCVSFDRKQALAAHEVCDRRHLALVGASSTLGGGFSTYVYQYVPFKSVILITIAVATLAVSCYSCNR